MHVNNLESSLIKYHYQVQLVYEYKCSGIPYIISGNRSGKYVCYYVNVSRIHYARLSLHVTSTLCWLVLRQMIMVSVIVRVTQVGNLSVCTPFRPKHGTRGKSREMLYRKSPLPGSCKRNRGQQSGLMNRPQLIRVFQQLLHD